MRILMAYRSLPRNISHRIVEFAYGWNEHLQNGKPPFKKKRETQVASASESDSDDDEEDESEAEPPAKKQKK